ncbi:hypothetical protein BWP39_29120 [Paraburkholderia acidicola]|uniref:Uncharacterized protein n=1 Tax=Paraburkholderia acidicola TaxID=1912599 RepID=A0A2A4EQ41_9BURK|nr:tetratricopeptide repeat protein [Paraburkholderia acidicola]PCE23743.1 hypothetical protein BWP39_29120 [Paraburkholderia acidicola]
MTELHSQQPAQSAELERLVRLEAYLQSDPRNASLLADAFDTAIGVGRHDAARRFVEQAEALFDGQSEQRSHWQFRRASLCMATHDDLEARRLLEALVASGETHPAIACNLAQLSFRHAAYAEALEQLQPLLERDDASAIDEVRVLALRIWHRLGQVTQALEWFDASVPRLDGVPVASATVMGVASLLALDAQRMSDAKAWSTHALTGDGTQMEALVTRGTIALAEDDIRQARQLLGQALEVNAEDGRAWSALAFVDMLDMQLASAETCFQRSLKTMPEHIGTWHGLAWCYLLQQKLQQAREIFEQALAIDRNFAESHGGLAVVDAIQDRREQAEQSIAVALKLDSRSLAARYAQAILREEANDPQAIRTLARHLLGSNEAAGVIRVADRVMKGG